MPSESNPVSKIKLPAAVVDRDLSVSAGGSQHQAAETERTAGLNHCL